MTSGRHDALADRKVVSLNEAGSVAYAGVATPTLALQGISLSFGGVKALTDVDLSVNPGEIRAIIGPNGAGKSSMVNVIGGVYRPNAGRSQFVGELFRESPDRAIGLSRGVANVSEPRAV